jgi:hypothetical protein
MKIAEATVLHEGWELDNSLWLEVDSEGRKKIYTTDHGFRVEADEYYIDKKIEEALASVAGLLAVKKLYRSK